MSDEIKIGDFYRTTNGLIRQVKTIKSGKRQFTRTTETLINGVHRLEDIVKHSKNIIDLIEIGDYVNGEYVYKITPGCIYFRGKAPCNKTILNIKTIVTKEQFANMEYKVGV